VTALSDSIDAGSIFFLDSAPVIYFVEHHPVYFALLESVFSRVDEGDLTVVTSPITLAECLFYPYKNKDNKLVMAFTRRLVTGHNVRLIPITADIADRSAQLRVSYNLGFADAFQVATALAAGCNILLTNDKHLKRIQSLDILVLSDFTNV
jgi:predicted nucleic acid-binding protein